MHITDEMGSYQVIGGKRVPVTPVSAEFCIDDAVVYRFDESTGVLELSLSPVDVEGLEKALRDNSMLPGASFSFDMSPFGKSQFDGVTSIKSIAKPDGSYYFGKSEPRQECSSPESRQTFFERIKRYVTRNI